MKYYADDVDDDDDDLIDDIEDDDDDDDDDDEDEDEDEIPEHLKPYDAANSAIQDAIDAVQGLVKNREISIAITNLEQAQLWLAKGTPKA